MDKGFDEKFVNRKLKGKKILIITKNEEDKNDWVKVFESVGANVFSTSSAFTALQKLKQESFTAILYGWKNKTDVQTFTRFMAEMGGLSDLIEKIPIILYLPNGYETYIPNAKQEIGMIPLIYVRVNFKIAVHAFSPEGVLKKVAENLSFKWTQLRSQTV